MRNATGFALIIGMFGTAGDTYAQKPDKPSPPRVQDYSLIPDYAERYRGFADSLLHPRQQAPPLAVTPPVDACSGAFEAAGVDPGILICPDSTIDAKIRLLRPPADADPGMTRPTPILPYTPRPNE